ncbi:MAG: SelL-related redox protein [Saprospiraceae bacterium]
MPKNIALSTMQTNLGESVAELSSQQPVLLIFLRHFGCTFCREALGDIAKQRSAFAEKNVEVVLVHMTDKEVADKYFEKYELEGIRHVSDPNCAYYQAFGLLKGNFHQLFGLQSWIRGFQAGVIEGHWVGYQQLGDGFQMPGAFAIRDGEVVDAFVHKTASDRPDYWKMVEQCALDAHML